MPNLIDALTDAASRPAHIRTGTVTSASPFTITLYGAEHATPAARLSDYTPTANDSVAVLIDSSGHHLVLGRITPADPAATITVPTYAY